MFEMKKNELSFLKDDTMVKRVALWPHSSKVPGSILLIHHLYDLAITCSPFQTRSSTFSVRISDPTILWVTLENLDLILFNCFVSWWKTPVSPPKHLVSASFAILCLCKRPINHVFIVGKLYNGVFSVSIPFPILAPPSIIKKFCIWQFSRAK